jgi:MFS family permease
MPRILGKDVPRSALVVLLFAGLSTLSSGTNYVVGSWAPQMADAVGLSSTDINLVAACGNFGVYLTGPLWGLYADTRGARTLLLVGAALLGFGYGGLALSYSAGAKLWMLALYSFCTGLGSCAGNTAGLNAVARCFTPETVRLAVCRPSGCGTIALWLIPRVCYVPRCSAASLSGSSSLRTG